MRDLRNVLAWPAAAILVVWLVSVSGGTGWSPTVNWTLFGVSLGLLLLRAAAPRR